MRWLPFACIVVWLSVVDQGQTREQQRNEQKHQPQANERQSARSLHRAAPTAKVGAQNREPTKPPSAQARAAESFKWVPKTFGDLIGVLTLFVTACFLYYTIKTWKEMVRANDNAEKSNEENGRNTAESLRFTQESNAETKRAVEIAKRHAAASEQQSKLAEFSTTAMQQQVSALLHQAEALTLQAHAAIKSAEAAQSSAETAKLMERPWVTASVIARRDLTFYTRGDAGIFFTLVLENIGRSAATDVHYAIELFPLGDNYASVLLARQAIIATRRISEPGFSLFPREVGSIPVMRDVTAEEIEECAWPHGDDNSSVVILCLAGVVTYRFATSDSEHTTRFAYYVSESEPDKDRSVIRVGHTLQPSEIVISKEHLGSYAD